MHLHTVVGVWSSADPSSFSFSRTTASPLLLANLTRVSLHFWPQLLHSHRVNTLTRYTCMSSTRERIVPYVNKSQSIPFSLETISHTTTSCFPRKFSQSQKRSFWLFECRFEHPILSKVHLFNVTMLTPVPETKDCCCKLLGITLHRCWWKERLLHQ